MKLSRSVIGVATVSMALTAGAPFVRTLSAVPQVPGAPADPANEQDLRRFAGHWDYNAAESVDAGTGQPEQAPRSAARRGVARGGDVPATGRGTALAPPSAAQGGRGGRRTADVGLTPEMIREERNLARDLLEVPETLTIAVQPAAVSFTDDLSRALTYPIDGKEQRYQLGAARFEAKMSWTDSQLKKLIEGPYGFKMTETYFLSPDARRLFVIIRVGEPKKDEPVSGINRVYDRIN